jgi:hypothetical protein
MYTQPVVHAMQLARVYIITPFIGAALASALIPRQVPAYARDSQALLFPVRTNHI